MRYTLTPTYQTTLTLYVENGFMIDIVSKLNNWKEAWIYHEDYGIKDMMFGMEEPMAEFITIIQKNLQETMNDYREQYMD